MTSILLSLIEQSAKPLASIETDFAVDSTGFSTSVYRRWYDAKYGREMSEATWLEAHRDDRRDHERRHLDTA